MLSWEKWKSQKICLQAREIFHKAAVVDCFQRDLVSNNAAPSTESVSTAEDHIKELAKFFDDIVTHLDDADALNALLDSVGSEHARLKLTCGTPSFTFLSFQLRISEKFFDFKITVFFFE